MRNDGFPVVTNKGFAFDETRKEATRFNIANFTQAILSQEITYYLFAIVGVGIPAEGCDDEDEEEDDDNNGKKKGSHNKEKIRKIQILSSSEDFRQLEIAEAKRIAQKERKTLLNSRVRGQKK